MQEIGQILQQAREEKGLSLDELSGQTMITKKYLRALEEGDAGVFPGEVYLKGALRKYAGELGLDADELLSRYNSIYGQKTEEAVQTKSKPVTAAKSAVTAAPKKVVRYTGKVNTGRLAVVLLVIGLFVVGIYAVISALGNTDVAVDVPPGNEVPGDEDPTGNEPPEIIEPEPEPEPQPPQVRVERDSRQDIVLFHVYNAEQVEAVLTFTDRCWVGMTADGRYTSDTFSRGQQGTVAFSREATIRLGFPPAAELSVNGVPVELPQRERAYDIRLVNAGFED